MSRFGSIDPVGILKAWTTNVRMNSARMTAMTSDSKYSRATDFLKGPAPLRGTRLMAPSPSPSLEHREKCFLRDLHLADPLHALLPSFCFSSSLRLRVMSPP